MSLDLKITRSPVSAPSQHVQTGHCRPDWGSVINQAYVEEKICYVFGYFIRPGGREETDTCLLCTDYGVSCACKGLKVVC